MSEELEARMRRVVEYAEKALRSPKVAPNVKAFMEDVIRITDVLRHGIRIAEATRTPAKYFHDDMNKSHRTQD